MVKFSGNAESSEVKPRYDLVPPAGVRYIAERMGKGAETREDPLGYLTGAEDEQFIIDRRNHAFEHLLNYINGRETEEDTPLDHLAAALTNLAMLAEIEEMRKLPTVTPVPVDDKAPVLDALRRFFATRQDR